MLKTALISIAILFSQGAVEAQVNEPYRFHSGHGANAYGWGFTPIINGIWYWNHYGLPFPTWAGAGFGYHYIRPLTFAALAYSPATGRYGSAWGSYDVESAAANAVGFCGAPDCQPTVWVANGCAAIAVGEENTALGWAYASSRYQANSAALRSCRRSGGLDCNILAWACSG